MKITATPQPDFALPVTVFVEGADEVDLLGIILKSMGSDDIHVRGIGGKDNLAQRFEAAIAMSSFQSAVKTIAIIQDADDSEANAFRDVCAVLKANMLPVPNTNGTIAQDAKYKVGVQILPGNGRQGFLENLFLDEHHGSHLLGCVDAFAACAAANGGIPFTDKRRAYAMLCALDAPQPRLGLGFLRHQLSTQHKAYDILRTFLQLL